MADHYTYRLSWSAEDQEHVATCAEFPSLSWLDEDEVKALRGIKALVRSVVEDLRASGEGVPEPLADKAFSGKFIVRVPPEQHRDLSIRAAEAGVSFNRYVSLKLSAAGGSAPAAYALKPAARSGFKKAAAGRALQGAVAITGAGKQSPAARASARAKGTKPRATKTT